MEDKNKISIRPDAHLSFDESGHFVLTNKTIFHDVIVISVPAFLKLESEMFRLFGSAAENILQITGEAAGAESGKRITHIKDLEDDIKSNFNSVSKWGFGRYKLIDLNLAECYLKFNLYENSLASHEEIINSEAQKIVPNHHFLIGFYKGYFAMVLNEQVICKETMCMNREEKYCQFEIRKFGQS